MIHLLMIIALNGKKGEDTMKKFKDWYEGVSGKEFPNAAIHNGNWFMEHGLPLVVSCLCCESTLLLPDAYLDDEGYIYCPSCAGVDE